MFVFVKGPDDGIFQSKLSLSMNLYMDPTEVLSFGKDKFIILKPKNTSSDNDTFLKIKYVGSGSFSDQDLLKLFMDQRKTSTLVPKGYVYIFQIVP